MVLHQTSSCLFLQIAGLKPVLQQTVEEWGRFEKELREVSLHTTRVRCALHHQPLFSLQQAEGYMDVLQVSKSNEYQWLYSYKMK